MRMVADVIAISCNMVFAKLGCCSFLGYRGIVSDARQLGLLDQAVHFFQVTQRVAAFVAQSKEYFESTDLALRVRTWHEKIAPKLEDVERRGDFDVHDCGAKILARFADDDVEGAPAAKARKTSYNFKELVVGKTPEEACRVFLSTLMLANTYNIEVKPIKSHPDEQMPMDNVELTLLSRTTPYEHLADFQAPSQASPSRASPASSSRGRHRREDRHDSRNGDMSPALATIDEEDHEPANVAVNGGASRAGGNEPRSSSDGSDFEFVAPRAKPSSKKTCKRKMKF